MHESHMEPVTGRVSPELLSQILLGAQLTFVCIQNNKYIDTSSLNMKIFFMN